MYITPRTSTAYGAVSVAVVTLVLLTSTSLTASVYADGQDQKALTFGISQYKVGFQLGRNDSFIGIDDSQAACTKYGPQVNYGPEWYCAKGYSDAQTQVQNGKLGGSYTNTIKASHRTLPYRIGFAAGVANKVGMCNLFNGRDTTICSNDQTNGEQKHRSVGTNR